VTGSGITEFARTSRRFPTARAQRLRITDAKPLALIRWIVAQSL
jgi:hypothetical protein